MDLNSILSTVLSSDSVSGMSQASQLSESEVQSVLGAALPSLLNGALAQSENSETAESFAGALSQHSARDTGDLTAFLSGVDLEDGSKIVGHLLGSSGSVEDISKKAGVSAAGTASVMSAAAPLLMSLLGQGAASQQQTSASGVAGLMGALLQNADMGSILSGLLGGGSAAQEDTLQEVTEDAEKEEESSGLLGLLGGLFKK